MARRNIFLLGGPALAIFCLASAARVNSVSEEPTEDGKGLTLPAFSAQVKLPKAGYIWSSTSTAVLYADPATSRFRFRVNLQSDVLDSRNQFDLNIHDSAINWTIGNLHGTSYCTVPPILEKVRPLIDNYGFEDPFEFLKYATKTNGSDIVNGEECRIWSSTGIQVLVDKEKGIQNVWPSDSQGAFLSGEACVAADGVPRRVRSNTGTSMVSMWWPDLTAELILHDVKIGTPSSDLFAPAASCGMPSVPCKKSKTGKETITMYRGLSMEEFMGTHGKPKLKNRVAGDLLGISFFVEQQGVDLVAKFHVTVNTSFAEWGFCEFVAPKNKCTGDQRLVGRGAPEGFFAKGAQCGRNTRLGSWFSLPGGGECHEEAEVGDAGCTWKARFVRAVTGKCIRNERGLSSTFASEWGKPPFKKSANVLQSALASPDPLRGGCPDAAYVTSESQESSERDCTKTRRMIQTVLDELKTLKREIGKGVLRSSAGD